MNLQTIGYDIFFESQVGSEELVGRVVKYAQNHFTLMTSQGIIGAELKGTLRLDKIFPKIGDFVVYRTSDDGSLHIITRILERKTALERKEAGLRTDAQIIAANMDYLFIVTSMNEDFNLRRLERFMVGAWESGAEPVIILTKMDLCDAPQVLIERVEEITFGVKTIALSALANLGMEQLEPFNQKGKTIALVGSSGVGKSTLINTLAGRQVMITDGLRNDDKGHHTTTHREMIFTEGAVLIDTPGMREFAVLDAKEGLAQEFEDIEKLSKTCKFSNCTHNNEPGCGVRTAIEAGQLAAKRYDNYLELQRELQYLEKKNRNKEMILANRKAKTQKKKTQRRKRWNATDY